MNLLIAPPGRPAPEPARVKREGAEAVLSASEGPLDGIRTVHVIDAAAPAMSECVDAARHPIGLACPHDEAHATGLAARVAGEVVRGTGGVLLDRVDAWYAAGPRGTGFCARCASALETAIATSYGEQYVPGATTARAPAAGRGGRRGWGRGRGGRGAAYAVLSRLTECFHGTHAVVPGRGSAGAGS
jgi:hypothetical protein